MQIDIFALCIRK